MSSGICPAATLSHCSCAVHLSGEPGSVLTHAAQGAISHHYYKGTLLTPLQLFFVHQDPTSFF